MGMCEDERTKAALKRICGDYWDVFVICSNKPLVLIGIVITELKHGRRIPRFGE